MMTTEQKMRFFLCGAYIFLVSSSLVANVTVSSATYAMAENLYLSSTNILLIETSCVIDGHGHTIHFARDTSDIVQIDAGVTVIFTHVVLKDFSDQAMMLGAEASVIFGDGTYVELANDHTLERDWTFAGTSYLYGFNKVLSLGFYNLGVLQPGSLYISDIVLSDLKNSNMRCIGDNATIYLDDTSLLLSHTTSFTNGALHIKKDVVLTGTNTFGYRTNKALTVDSQARLILDTGMTFSYSPSIADKDLIALTDVTSRISMKGCSLKTTTTGLRLTKGTLIIDHKNLWYNDGATTWSEAICIGSGTVSDDLAIEVMPGGSIEMYSGRLAYANRS